LRGPREIMPAAIGDHAPRFTMQIQDLPSGGRVRSLSLDEMSQGERDTLQGLQDDKAHNVYFTPGLAPILANQKVRIPAIHYSLSSTRTVFYAAKAPANDKGLLNREGKLIFDFADLSTGSTAAPLWEHAPNLAGIMPEVNIVIGVVGCYDKLSHTGLQKRIGGGLCLADMAVKTLLLLGHFIPGLQHMASYLMVVQLGIKIGDKYVEYQFSGKDKPGQEVLKAVEISVSNLDVVQLPVTPLGKALMDSAGLTARTQKTPPAS
jgi:hypothetical protein